MTSITVRSEGFTPYTDLSRSLDRLHKKIVSAFKRQNAAILNLSLYNLEEMTDSVILPSEVDELCIKGLLNAKLTGVYTWEMSLLEQAK